MKRLIVTLAGVALVFGFVLEAFAIPMYDGLPAVRYRSFGNTGGNEVYEGVHDLGVAGNRIERGYTWPNPASEQITFEYDPTLGTYGQLITTGGFGTLTYDLESELTGLNVFEISVADRDAEGQVNFLDVAVDGVALGDFVGDGTWQFFDFVAADLGIDLNDGFLFTGTIELSGTFSGSQELSKVEIKTGYDPEIAIPDASTLLLFGSACLIGLGRSARRRFRKE
jgi:hypothetical protein